MLLPSATTPENDSPKVTEALEYLKAAGMTVEHLRDLHHSEFRTETYNSAVKWRAGSGSGSYGGGNPGFHRRLLYVAAEHWRTGRAFSDLIVEALEMFPKGSST